MSEASPKKWKRFWRGFRWVSTAMLLITIALSAKVWSDTMGDPVVHRASVALQGMAAGEAPITAALISDIHIAGPDMTPKRLERIVGQINALSADIVLIAGDMISEKKLASHIYTAEEAVAPLGGLTARLGVWAVPGNHDHWFDMPALAAAMEAKGVHLLSNEAAQAGPLVIGGLDDDYTGRADLSATIAAMEGLSGGRLILSHSPDAFPDVPASISLTLAGHTHCGQIGYPWGGAPMNASRYGDKYACGVAQENGKTVITGAGLGTSVLPLRLFTRAEIWLVELKPVQ